MFHLIAGLNILLGLVGFTWLLVRSWKRTKEYPSEIALLLLLALTLFFGLLTTSIEQYARDDSSYSAIAISLVKVFALYVLWKTETSLYRTGTRKGNESDNHHPNEDI
jgi:nitrate reductase gamma subunit